MRTSRGGLRMRIEIIGTGRAVPAACVTSRALDERLGLGNGQLEAATGVIERYVCEAESQVDLACVAARLALADAGIEANAIDLVIGGCGVPYQPLPSTAPLVMQRLGMADGSAAAFDVNSTCLGFLTAFETAGRMIDAGQCERALIFSSEIASRALPWKDQPEIAALFGDGAAAAVLCRSASGDSKVVANLMRTYPSAYDACGIGSGGTRFDFHGQPQEFASHTLFHMDGKELFRVTSRHFNGSAPRSGMHAEAEPAPTRGASVPSMNHTSVPSSLVRTCGIRSPHFVFDIRLVQTSGGSTTCSFVLTNWLVISRTPQPCHLPICN